MARKRKASQRKLRTREHVVADLAVNYVERQVLLCGFAVDRTRSDYGIDLLISTTTGEGEIEPGYIKFQVKGSDKIRTVNHGLAVAWRVDVRDLRNWLFHLSPIILVVYDAVKEVAYWIHVQGYFHALKDFDLDSSSETVTIHLPVDWVLTPDAVRGFPAIRDQAFLT